MTYAFSNPEFLADFEVMSSFGATGGGGVDRQAGSAADHETRAWFAEWLQNNGFRVEVDAIGNQFGLIELVEGAPYVLLGSHLDSQPLAGRFDGAYGVLSAAHAARSVVRAAHAGEISPRFNLAVVNWFNEEGSRFSPAMMGSGVFTGKLALDAALSTTDRGGTTVAEALARGDFEPGNFALEVVSYGEIHIEQGRLLDTSSTDIGLVDRTWAASKYLVTIHGEQGHTGSTIMRDRKDALYGAALAVVAARELTNEFPEGQLHSSVSELTLEPNSPVTLAREVTINLDLRTPDESILARANERLDEIFCDIEDRARVSITRTLTHEWGLLAYQPEGVELAREASKKLGLSCAEIMTVAGHDSTNMKDTVPTVMLFVPSVDGVSHNEKEFTRDEDCVAGVALLTEVAARMLEGALVEGALARESP